MKKRIVIDPGHGGSNSGAINGIVKEKALTLPIAFILTHYLKQDGVDVILTRMWDETVSLRKRCQLSNNRGADLFVSIHCNSIGYTKSGDKKVSGIETFYFKGSKKGKKLANYVQNSLTTAFKKHKDRGIKTANFFVLRRTRATSILVECEFMSNDKMLQFLLNSMGEIACAIYSGIFSYLSLSEGDT